MKRPPLILRLLVATALFAALAALCLRHYCPPLPNPLTVDLVLQRGAPGQSEPLVVAGREFFGDFLFVRHVDATHVIFGYDSWGHPGHVGTVPVAFTPGQPLRLRLTLPAFDRVRGDFTDPPGPVRVECAGATVFSDNVHYFMRQPAEIFLAENPLGGSACGPRLHGQLRLPDGRELRGNPENFLSFRDRLEGWFRHTLQPFALLALSGAIVFGWLPLHCFRPTALRALLAAAARLLTAHRWFAGTVAVSAAVFGWMVTWGELRFDYPEQLGSFYDFQAVSFLHGRLDVPDEAIGGEAFVIGDKLYGYFGPTPALLRLPFVIFGFAFGNLTRAFLLGYFVAALTAGYLLLRLALRLTGATGAPSPWSVVLLLGNAGLGSTLFFLGSRAYVYHEAILCGAAFALFACYFALHHLAEPTRRWWLWSLLCGLLSLHARPPTGLFALTFLGCVCATHLLRELRARSLPGALRPAALGLLCVVGAFTFNGLAYLKFNTFEGTPLRFSRPYDAERLAKIDGKSFHAANLPYGAYTYLVRPNFRFEPKFPWFYLGANTPPHFFERAKIDLPDHTNALPWAMPALVLLATVGCAAAFARFPAARTVIVITWAAVVPMSLALFTAIATAQRYTGDFVPFLICAAALGLAAVESAAPRWRQISRSALAVLTAAAILQTSALTLHYQREVVWGVPEDIRQNYQLLRQRIDRLVHP